MNVGSRSECLSPVLLHDVLEEPAEFRDLIERHAPYLPVQRYFAGNAEYRSSSGQGEKMMIAPNFRGDWAYEKPLVDGASIFFDHPRFVEAARQMFDALVVRPLAVYTNLTWQLPFHQGAGHTDVPAFRGIDRKQYPIWFLQVMGHSGLFEEERINIATAVAWFYRGTDGGLEYWPAGPNAPSKIHEGAIFNTAILGDNDRMYHRVCPVGSRRDGLQSGMTLDSALEHVAGDTWQITEAGQALATFPYEKLRISVSWKAEVFADAEACQRVDDHRADLTLEAVLARFEADFAARGVPFCRPADPLRDEDFISLLSEAYIEAPTLAA